MRFDLTAEDSISAHGIWDSIRFANFRDSIWSCKIWEPNPWITNVYAAHVLVGPFPFHKHNNDMASAWEHFVCNQRVEVPTLTRYATYLAQPPTSDPPETFWGSTLSDDYPTLRQLAKKYLSSVEQCCGSNCSCLPQQTIGIYCWVTAA